MSGRMAAFVVGCPRSGTTLVQQLLNRHPAVRIGPETHFVHRFWQRRSRYGDWESDAGWARLTRDVAAMPELRDMGVAPAEVVEGAAGLRRDPAELLALLLELFGRTATVTGEKTPNHVLYMPLIQRWLPEARFIHVLRDPRAVVHSWRDVPWTSGTRYGDAAIWRHYVGTALRNPPRPGTLLIVRYERLVANPGPELDRVCGFLGVAPDPRILAADPEASGDDPTPGLDPEREPWKGRAARPPSPARADRWRAGLTRGEVFSVEATVGPLMTRVGYTPTTSVVFRRAAGPAYRAVAAVRRAGARGSLLPRPGGRTPAEGDV